MTSNYLHAVLGSARTVLVLIQIQHAFKCQRLCNCLHNLNIDIGAAEGPSPRGQIPPHYHFHVQKIHK